MSEINNSTIEIIEKSLKKYFSAGGYPILEESMAYSLFAGGKRIRPLILLETFKLFSNEFEICLPFACALEMIHTYSLIHDDLPCMDNDDTRRGKPTNHLVFGYANAVLAGDGLLNLAFETMLEHTVDEKTILASRVIAGSSGRKGMISGQSADIYFETKKASEAELNYIHDNKTGALFYSAFVVGAILGGANENSLDSVKKLALSYGKIFQLTDDLLDKYGDKKHLGKTIGKDEKSFKSSALYILGEERTREMIERERQSFLITLKKLDKNTEFFKKLIEDTVGRKK